MPDRPAAGHPSDLGLLWRQVRAQNKLFLRNPFSAFFSLAFPVMFLLLFGSLNGSGRIPELNNIRYIQFLAPGMVAFAVISTCYTGLVTGVAINRDEGLLKRILSAVWFSVVSAVLMVVVAVLLFNVEVIGRMLPAAVVTLLLGAACFCSLGMAVAAVIPNGEAAPVIANFTFFPVAFVSDLFFPTAGAPAWVGTVGSIFPIKHFAVALEGTFNPFVPGSGFQWGHLGVMVLWMVVGVVVAVRFFRWEPKVGAPAGGRRSRRPTTASSRPLADDQ
jgi:ABC-2 type transport system permease protein